jgi:AraC family transcriptional regulator, arabinose operon regulatory protein
MSRKRCGFPLLLAMGDHALSIHDPAMTHVTPAPKVDRILTGHERRQRDHCRRPSGTDDWLLIHTLAGRANVIAAQARLAIEEGDTLLFRPGTPHDFASDERFGPWELCWAHFHPPAHWIELLRWPERAAGVHIMPAPAPPLRSSIEVLLVEMDRLSRSRLPLAERLAMNALEAALLRWEIQNPARRLLDPRIIAAIDHLSQNADRAVSISELASAVHLSESRFAHLFRTETGVAPHRFAEAQRIDRAKQLLELTSMPIKAIAEEVGYRSPFHFATRFKRLTNETPSEFRSQRQAG